MAKNNHSKIIQEIKFEQSYNALKVIPVINLMLFLIFLTLGLAYISSNYFTLFSLVSGLVFLFLIWIYNWRSTLVNLIILIAYASSVIIELIFFKTPRPGMEVSHGINKGTILELLISGLPMLYKTLRLMTILFVIPVVFRSWNMDNT